MIKKPTQQHTNNKNKAEDPAVAVALSYKPDEKEAAPVVVATGEGFIAERIIEEAEKHGVTIRKDADLIEILKAAEVGEQIPVEAFIAVAEVLRYIYKKNGQQPPTST